MRKNYLVYNLLLFFLPRVKDVLIQVMQEETNILHLQLVKPMFTVRKGLPAPLFRHPPLDPDCPPLLKNFCFTSPLYWVFQTFSPAHADNPPSALIQHTNLLYTYTQVHFQTTSNEFFSKNYGGRKEIFSSNVK